MDIAQLDAMRQWLKIEGQYDDNGLVALAYIAELEGALRQCIAAYDEHDAALAWARLWKRAALINRLDERRYRPFWMVREDARHAVRAEYPGWRAQARALGLPDE